MAFFIALIVAVCVLLVTVSWVLWSNYKQSKGLSGKVRKNEDAEEEEIKREQPQPPESYNQRADPQLLLNPFPTQKKQCDKLVSNHEAPTGSCALPGQPGSPPPRINPPPPLPKPSKVILKKSILISSGSPSIQKKQCDKLVSNHEAPTGSCALPGQPGSPPPRINPPLPLPKPSKVILETSILISSGSPSIYKISTKILSTISMKGDAKIEKRVFGKQPSTPKPTRVFMVVGATGAGKSTLINGMVNYALGVEWKDDFRFKLITDEVAQSQAHSQTQNITSYTLYWQEGSPLNYNLTIIDTPGFGDTRGIKRDKQITALIKEFFELKGDKGIDQIHGIGFVTQSSLARLTATQKYVFDSVLSVFGNDIRDNIFIMATFADGMEPPVKGAVIEAKIPFCNFLSFNNGFLFAGGGIMNELFWKMGYDSFEAFFLDFNTKQPVSLQLTRDVLKERQNLETTIEGLQKRITAGLAKINELNQEEKILKDHETDIERNKNFVTKVKIPKQRRVDISGQQWYVTNCNVCNFTCHERCAFNNDGDKYLCGAMDGGGQANARCTACPGKCHWRQHVNNSFYYELYEEEETRTLEDIQKKYNLAQVKKGDVQKIVKQMEAYLESLHQQVLRDIREVRNCLERLNKIALKPNPLTDTEYIDLIIQSEQNEKKQGFDQRIQYLQEVKKQAELMASLSDQMLDNKIKEGARAWWQYFQRR